MSFHIYSSQSSSPTHTPFINNHDPIAYQQNSQHLLLNQVEDFLKKNPGCFLINKKHSLYFGIDYTTLAVGISRPIKDVEDIFKNSFEISGFELIQEIKKIYSDTTPIIINNNNSPHIYQYAFNEGQTVRDYDDQQLSSGSVS